MESSGFHDDNIHDLPDTRRLDGHQDVNHSLQMHSSLIRRLSLEKVMELNIWSYYSRKLFHSIETGHSANIFCAKFVPKPLMSL